MAQALRFLGWTSPDQCCRIGGDIDYDGQGPNIADLVALVNYMFSGGPAPAPCP